MYIFIFLRMVIYSFKKISLPIVEISRCVFESVVIIIFQNIFYFKTHQNNIFLFLKIIFNIGRSK
jgi:hypothetical protein